jgi:hypothetical protein
MNTFNNRFINSWKELQTAVIGFEFEFFSNYSYIKTMELLNLEFDPIEIWGFNQYHSDFEVTDTKFKIEPDYSGGSEMIELITGPINWVDSRVILIKALNFIKKHGYTNDYCSIHINISFTDISVKDMNPIKLILNFNEDFVYDKFPDRRNNIYARSIKWVVPFEDWDDSEIALNSIIQCVQIPDDTKYYGVNIQKKWMGYLEYRYIGGADYENKTDDILSLMDYFILQTRKSVTEELLPEDNIKLLSYLEDNINWFKQYKTYDEFLSNISGVNIEVDQVSEYNAINASWDKLKNKLFDIIKSCDSIKDAIVNYNTTTNRLEIVDAVISNIHYLKGVDFVNCKITECTLYDCYVIDTEIDGGHIYNSKIYESKLNTCKLSNCDAMEWSELTKCMFDGGLIDCIMKDGVFRSGEIGSNAQIDMTVKMANKDTFWAISPKDKLIKGIKK